MLLKKLLWLIKQRMFEYLSLLLWTHLLPYTIFSYKKKKLCTDRPLVSLCVCVCILLTVLKFQTRLKESLFLRLILISSHTGGNPLTAQSTYLNHTNAHENSCSHTNTCALTLTELLRGELSRAGNSCKQLTRVEPCLSVHVTHSSKK